ncbi:MAG: hypothetical protein K9I86_00930 [Cryomorphaceae bacterium]|nr:hypothetical protein [Cryomorphaceae bacterium]
MKKIGGLNINSSYLFPMVLIVAMTLVTAPAIHARNSLHRSHSLRKLGFIIAQGGDEVGWSKTIEASQISDADALGHQEADLLDYRPIQILKN